MTALPLEDAGVAPEPRGEATRQRILDAAERLFSERGINGVSLRAITAAAGANSAAANYHFGSKKGLLHAVFERHATGMAAERATLLADCRTAPGRPPLVEQIISAFLEPGMRGEHGGTTFALLRGRMLAENSEQTRELYALHLNDSTGRFLEALGEAMPALPAHDLHWRFHMMLGAMVYTLANPGRIQILTENACDPSDPDQALDYLVPMLAQMFCSPPIARTAKPVEMLRTVKSSKR
ncbi:MAG: TetR/AcrR family transcriptional regulator [Alphaproteobacteria bacterium]